MEGVLLGALSFLGNNKTKIKTEPQNKNNLYDTNMDNNMNIIETNQALTLKQPEFYQQFDSLTFNNLSKPTGENESYMTRSGFNQFLQRDIDFKNGYSDFQNTDMHYGVVTKEGFVHNNMVPHTSRRDTFVNLSSNNRKYENLSGNNAIWNHKKEVETFFDPVKDMSNVNGMPVVSGSLSNRYITSFRNNNGNLPFQSDLKVLPGLEGHQTAPYPVVRIDPRNIDELRSEINKKVSYLNKPLQVIKKGDLRAVEPTITTFKIPSYRVITANDLVANRHDVQGPKQTGNFVHIETERGTNDINYTGGATDTQQGKIIDTKNIYFSEPKKENYLNDFTHSINAVNSRPVFTNKESWTNYETDRDTIATEFRSSGIYNNSQSLYYNDKNNVAKPTMKENNINQDRNIGITGPLEKKSYMFSNDSILPTTHRETSNYNQVSNSTPSYQNTHLTLQDEAKPTIKETNILNITDANITPSYQNTHLMLNDNAKSTIKQSTVDNCLILNSAPTYKNTHLPYQDKSKITIRESTIDNFNKANPAPTYKNTHTTLTDKAKPTIKESTIINSIIKMATPTVTGNIIKNNDKARITIREETTTSYNGNPTYQISSYINNEDEARNTIRETTENNEYIGLIGGPNNKETYTNYEDIARNTIKQTTLIETPIQNMIANVPKTYSKNSEEARSTIKETLLHEAPGGRMYDNNQSNYKSIDDAKITIKQTTLITDYTGIATHDVNSVRVEDAERNMTIRDKRQQTALGGRISNAKSDQIRGTINPDTIKFQNKRTLLEGYVSTPGTSANYSITPFERTSTSKKTDLNSNNFYRVDPLFIEKLNNNPLVNDLMHPKNTNFNTGN